VAASRYPEKLSVPTGIETRHIDFDDTNSLNSAFAGIDRALIISTDRNDVPGLRITQHGAAIHAARAAGVQHLVYTSMLNPEDSLVPFAPDHRETELIIAGSGLDYSILRVSWYADGLLPNVASAFESGKWYSCAGDGRINYVTRDDVARAAAAALISRAGSREHLDITGPQPHTVADIAAIASRLGASPIEVIQVSETQRAEHARAAGISEEVIALTLATDATIRTGRFDVASTAVADLTGTAATSVEAFLAARKVMWQP
jgi:NAD(P)H dehydrogenase (quinone)